MSTTKNSRFGLFVATGVLITLACWMWPNRGSFAGVMPRAAAGEPLGAAATAYLPLIAGQPPLLEKIAFESAREGNYEIYLMNPDGSDQRNLTQHPAKDVAPAWSPVGRQMAFVSDRDGNEEIYVMDLVGSGPEAGRIVRLTNQPGFDGWPTWSPDGTRIAFQSDRADGRFDIYVMNADGSGQARLTTHPSHDRWPAWSPDGALITFTSNRNIFKKIFVMRPDGSRQRAVLDADEYWDDRYSTWVPDGRLTFNSNRPAPSDGSRDEEIYILNLNGSVQQLIDNRSSDPNEPGDWLARWSPDGTRFVFYSDRDGPKNIYMKDMATGSEVRLTGGAADDEYPVWSP